MKATISSTGALTVTSENEIEAYALSQWQKSSIIDVEDMQRNEKSYYKGSSIKVSTGNFYNKSICGMVVYAGEVPFVSGLDRYTKYKGVFVSDSGGEIAVDGATEEYGDIIATTWTGELKHGDLVKLRQN